MQCQVNFFILVFLNDLPYSGLGWLNLISLIAGVAGGDVDRAVFGLLVINQRIGAAIGVIVAVEDEINSEFVTNWCQHIMEH